MSQDPTQDAALRGEDLTLGYPELPGVLRHQSLRVARGRITALVGPNGSGKSTLLKALGHQLRPQAGRVWLGGDPIADLSPRQRARRLGSLPQETPGSPLTVEALVQHGRHPHRRLFEDLTPQDRQAIERALELAGVAPLRHRPLDSLSGGQRQLAWCALVLAQEPEVMLLDEPTTYLDLHHQIEFMELLTRLRDQRQVTIVMVLHDINLAVRYCDELVALRQGRVVAQGPPRQAITPQVLRQVFGIEAELLTTRDGHLFCAPLGLARPEP